MAVQQLDGSELDGRQLHVTRQLNVMEVKLWRFCLEYVVTLHVHYILCKILAWESSRINHFRTTMPHQCGLPPFL